MFGLPRTHLRPRNVRLDTLVRLRWLAVFGQFAAVLVVHLGLEFDVPIWPCLGVIALSAVLNLALRVNFRHTQWLEPERAAYLLGFDIAQLAALLYLTGGLENPFSFLLLGPVLIAATALPTRLTLLIGVFAMVCATVLVFFHYQLPWEPEEPLELPETYVVGVWLSILLAIGYIGVYTWQIAEEARQLSDALAATELVLQREQSLSQLDGLAAAAAHELGTPLSTITVVAREIERALEPHSPHAEDVKLLREQAHRCREILAKITELPTGEPFDRLPISALIEEAVAPHRNFGVSLTVTLPANRAGEPAGARNPGIRYGLGNLIENAVDFANTRVQVLVQWTADEVGDHHQRRRAGPCPRGRGPNRRALRHPQAARAPRARRRRGRGLRARPGLLHCQNITGTFRGQALPEEPGAAASRGDSYRYLESRGFRAFPCCAPS